MGYFKADACEPLGKLYRIATRGPVDRQLGSETKYVVCARRKLYGNIFNHDPLRNRRLLLHRAEINKLIGKVKEKGYALVPLKLYFKHGLVKMELALAVGKKNYDKRQDLAKKDAKREMERALKERNR